MAIVDKTDKDRYFCVLKPVRGSRYTKDALQVRETLRDYVNSEAGSVSWQKITLEEQLILF